MKRQLHCKSDEEVSKCWLLDTSQNKGDQQKQLEESTTLQTQQQQSQNCKSMALFQYFNPFATSWLFLAIENLVANSQSSRDSSYVATRMVFSDLESTVLHWHAGERPSSSWNFTGPRPSNVAPR
jgi:hypothetical protein